MRSPLNTFSAPVAPPTWTSAARSTVFLFPSTLTWSWPRGGCSHSLDHSLQEYLWTRTITASKCAPLLPPSLSPNWLGHSLQVRTIMASKCIYTLAWSRPPCSCPNLLEHGLWVHHQTPLSWASKCISKLARLWPRSASLCLLNHCWVKRWSWKADSPSSTLCRTLHGIRREFMSKSGSSSRTIGRGLEDMEGSPAMMNPTHWVDPRSSATVPETKSCEDRVSVSYNKMMSNYPGVSQIHAACRWVHLLYPCISVCIYTQRPR